MTRKEPKLGSTKNPIILTPEALKAARGGGWIKVVIGHQQRRNFTRFEYVRTARSTEAEEQARKTLQPGEYIYTTLGVPEYELLNIQRAS